jgi:hypothetical protein
MSAVSHALNSKRELACPQALREGEVMWHQASASAAARISPRHTIELALAGLGPSLCPSESAPIGKGCVVLGRSHGLSGNPSRFRCDVVTLQVDEAWREWMSRRDRFLVTAIGLPLLLRYGRRPLGRSSPRASDE